MKKESISDKIKSQVSEKRWKHIQGVITEAGKLAEIYGVPVEKAELAALFHDMCRNLSEQELNGYIKSTGLGDVYLDNVPLSHSKAAALLMEVEHGIIDQDLLNAVSYHTTGRSGMSTLEKIIFVADAIEPGRLYDGVDDIRKLAITDLDKACILSLQRSIKYVESKGETLHEDSKSALRFLTEEKKRLK